MELGSVNAVGVWFYSLDTQRYLYLMRDDAKHPGSWGLPGGKVEATESLLAAISRECEEEIGQFPEYVRLVPLEKFTSADGRFAYHTFFCCVAREFQPVLNE
jgi:ADP-ribose pyrophosphatase YjhB (NUDIX family)